MMPSIVSSIPEIIPRDRARIKTFCTRLQTGPSPNRHTHFSLDTQRGRSVYNGSRYEDPATLTPLFLTTFTATLRGVGGESWGGESFELRRPMTQYQKWYLVIKAVGVVALLGVLVWRLYEWQ